MKVNEFNPDYMQHRPEEGRDMRGNGDEVDS